jgi:hypothetical protein
MGRNQVESKSRRKEEEKGRKESAKLTSRTPGFMGGTREERKSRRKEEEEGRKESVELTRTLGFMGGKTR